MRLGLLVRCECVARATSIALRAPGLLVRCCCVARAMVLRSRDSYARVP